MQAEKRQLPAGLWLVPTPIGNARDITLRALDVLTGADVLAAEDTRNLRHLLDIHGVLLDGRRVVAWHDHSSDKDRERLVELIREGCSVAYASDAGMPIISDPGFVLARDVLAAGLRVEVLPGASAVLTALVASGLPAERFQFLGFPPVKKSEREALWGEIKSAELTTILFESARRSSGTIAELVAALGPDRQGALCRELTKKFETIMRGSLQSISEQIEDDAMKGEVVILIGRADQDTQVEFGEALRNALKTMSVKEAAESVSLATGMPRRQVYQAALALKVDDAKD